MHMFGTLVKYANIPADGVFHRALYDSEMTAELWLAMLDDIDRQYNRASISFALLQKLTKTPKRAVHTLLERR